MTVFTGSSENDIFTGGDLNDSATGGRGSDRLSGGGGNDVLAGNAGADIISGGSGADWLFSGDASDSYLEVIYFDVGREVDVLTGGAGDDHLFIGYGDSADGGDNDSGGDRLIISLFGASLGQTIDFNESVLQIGGGTITGIEAVLVVQGTDYGDTLTMRSSGSDDDKVYGMGGDDRLIAGTRTALMDGGSGNDFIDARSSYNSLLLYGGDGNDTIYCNNTFSFTDGGAGNDIIYGYGQVSGGAGDDQIFVQMGNPGRISGDAGNDKVVLSNNDSFCAGNAGADTITGGTGDDWIYSGDFKFDELQHYLTLEPADDMGLEVDKLAGGDGDDRIAIGYGDFADGGAGSDRLEISLGGLKSGTLFDTKGIVSGKAFTLGGGTIKNIETLVYLRGTEFNDTLTLATQDTLLEVNAGAGDDTIISNASSVAVMGGKGADRFISGVAGDAFDGGDGVDIVDYSRSTTAVTVNLNTGVGARGDTLTNVESITGSNLNDTLTGSAVANVLDGGKGADKLEGGAGDDVYVVDDLKDTVTEGKNAGVDTVNAAVSWTLGANLENLTLTGSAGAIGVGNAVANTLVGNGAANILRGLGGADVLTGGAGADVFDFDSVSDSTVAAFDRITDLTDSDRIDLSGIDANTKAKGDQAFAIVDAFTHKAGQMTLAYSAATKLTTILMDVDGDGKADMKIVLNGDQHDYDNFFL